MSSDFPDISETPDRAFANAASTAALRTQCEELRRHGSAQEALDLLHAVVEEHPADIVSLLRAQALNDLGRYEEALTASAHALEAGPECSDARFAQGYALCMLQRRQEARDVLDALVAADPAYPNAAWLRAGTMRQIHGDLDDSVLAAFDLAAEVDPENLYLRVERADLLRARGRYEEAHDVYSDVRTVCEDELLRVETIFKLGCVALVLHDTPAALDAFNTVLEIDPDYPDAEAMRDLLKEQA